MLSHRIALITSIAVACTVHAFNGVAARIQEGSWVVTASEKAPVQVPGKVLFVLAKNSHLVAEQIRGNWVLVSVRSEGTRVRGWVQAKYLVPMEKGAGASDRVLKAQGSVAADQVYTAFSLNVARKKIEALPPGSHLRAMIPKVFYTGGITQIRGLVVDPDTGDAILVGQYVPGRARITIDDVAAALRSRLVHGQWPVVSIDPPRSRDAPRIHTVRFEGGVSQTEFGQTLFDADYLLKKISLGLTDPGVTGVRSKWDLWQDEARRSQRSNVHIQSRAWFFPIIASIPSRRNVAAFRDLKIGVFTEMLGAEIDGKPVEDLTKVKSSCGREFVAMLREHYDALSGRHPSFRRLVQLNELVALTRAIEVMEEKPDLAWWLEEYPLSHVETPRQVDELSRSTRLNRYRKVSSAGGVQLRAMALRFQAGDVTALSDAVLKSKSSDDDLTWNFVIDDWVIPIPPDSQIKKGAEVTPHFMYAVFLLRQGHHEQAMEQVEEILAIEPNYWDAWLLKGDLLRKKHEMREAVDCYDRLLEKVPESTAALMGRGLARMSLHNTREAMGDFDAAISINPRLAAGYLGRAHCHSSRGRIDEALTAVNESLRLAPRQPLALALRGGLFRRKGEFDKALDDLNKALSLDASLTGAVFDRAQVLYERKEYAKAIPELTQVLRERETKPALGLRRSRDDALFFRSESYRKTRQFAEALADCHSLNIFLFLEVTSESAQLWSRRRVVATVTRGQELQVVRVDGNTILVELVREDGTSTQGWIDSQHVR